MILPVSLSKDSRPLLASSMFQRKRKEFLSFIICILFLNKRWYRRFHQRHDIWISTGTEQQI
jgi:hypothetical protein